MPKLWLSYAWADNENADVDHVIGELRRAGVTVLFDRAHIVPGQRIWPQIDAAISDSQETDGWAIFATPAALQSEPVLEELAYALDRALRTRGSTFPLIGIFPAPIERALIPSAIATRLYVNLADPGWAQAVVAGLRHQAPPVELADQLPFVINVHRPPAGTYVIEIRPRTGRWYPCVGAVPETERDLLIAAIAAPKDVLPGMSAVSYSEIIVDGTWKGIALRHSIDPLTSGFYYFRRAPSRFKFGDGATGRLHIADIEQPPS